MIKILRRFTSNVAKKEYDYIVGKLIFLDNFLKRMISKIFWKSQKSKFATAFKRN